MAELHINITEIKNNIKALSSYLKSRNKKWSLIIKVLSGDIEVIEQLLTRDVIEDIHSFGDSRLSSLQHLKELNANLTTVYIKPPPKAYVDDIVRYADISLNSSYKTVIALNDAAIKQNKVHRIIIMVELGELREGVNRADLFELYEKVYKLSNIKVEGLGSNLGCMYGIEPSFDKLHQLVLYKDVIEARYGTTLEVISGGSSISLPLIENKIVPSEINHFRIGEAAFFGVSPLDAEQFLNLHTDAFVFRSQIIELEEKNIVPDGIISDASIGYSAEFDIADTGKTAYKAILDFGLLDVDKEGLIINDKCIKFVGITSDMTVIDIGDNIDEFGNILYDIGDDICMNPNYMAVARLLNSKFIEKIIID